MTNTTSADRAFSGVLAMLFIVSTAGTIAMRTTNASKNTAIASPKPIILIICSLEPMKPAKTAIMMTAAAITTRAL